MSERRSPAGSELRVKSPSSPVVAATSSSSSSSSSNVAILSPREGEEIVQGASAPETKAMRLVGCPRCFMYVMLSEADPKCPKCKSTTFLHFFREEDLKTDGE